MNASYRFAKWGVLSLRALTGGQPASACGEPMALAIIGVCGFTSVAAPWWSPLRRCRVPADAAADPHGPGPKSSALTAPRSDGRPPHAS